MQVLVSSFAYVHISTTTHLKRFIFGPWMTSRVCFHSMNPGLTVHAGGGTRGKKNSALFKVLFYFSVIKAMFVNSCLCIVGTCNIDLGIMD